MKNLLSKIAEKAAINQKELTRLSEKFSTTESQEEKLCYLQAVMDIYDEMMIFVNFYIANEENIGFIIDGRNQALDIYKKLTGKDYTVQQEEVASAD